MDSLCLVFPSRRSLSYFKKYLAEAIRSNGSSPVMAPRLVTIGDFFAACSPRQKTSDRITLLVRLYRSYCRFNPSAEPLDEFIFWGDVILGDFSDVDKYLADPHQVFSNVSDFKDLQDDLSHLTPQQKAQVARLTRFMDNFKEKPGAGSAKEKFLRLWNVLELIYNDFRDSLGAEGLCYDGMIYRNLAERLSSGEQSISEIMAESFPGIGKFVFVGLNVLNPCEHLVLSKMQNAHIAEFCWDFAGDMIQNKDNKSSKFLSRNIVDFPPAFPVEKIDSRPQVSVVSVPSGVGQVKQIPYILEKVKGTCAIVLPDETLLMPLLNSIPPQVGNVNVTMGLTMSASEMFALLDELLTLQMHLRFKDGTPQFYHRQVWTIFANAVFKKAVRSEVSENAAGIISAVRESRKYYIPQEALRGDSLLEAVFTPVVRDASESSADVCEGITGYLKNVITILVDRISALEEMSLQVHFAKEYYCSLVSLEKEHLCVLPATMMKLIRTVTCSLSVPFEGSSMDGLQIMGPLETRALDFDNVIIISCNEGTFPRRSTSASFIPPLLRADFGLPTYELKDCVWAYYFYRMICRAGSLWMVYDSRTEGLCSGEESRFIKQLKYHFGVPLTECEASSSPRTPAPLEDIAKTPQIMDLLHSEKFHLSASALEDYMQCPVRFYYKKVRGLGKDDEVAENLDAGAMGTAFHLTMKLLYGPDGVKEKDAVKNVRVSRRRIKEILDDKALIRSTVARSICYTLLCDEVTGRDLVTAEVIFKYVCDTLRRDMEILDAAGKDAFLVKSLEEMKYFDCGSWHFKAQLDRLDSLDGCRMRIVDYKTGGDSEEVLSNPDVVKKFFDPATSYKVKAAFQFFLYQKALEADGVTRGSIDNSLYQMSALSSSVPGIHPVDESVYCGMQKGLDDLLSSLDDPEHPFSRTRKRENCEFCDFKTLCGR